MLHPWVSSPCAASPGFVVPRVPMLHPGALRFLSPGCLGCTPGCRSPLHCTPACYGPHGAPRTPGCRGCWGEQLPSAPPQVVNPRKKMKKKKYLNSGTVRIGGDMGRGHRGVQPLSPAQPLVPGR